MERYIPEKGNLLERIKWKGLSYLAIALVAYGCSHNKQEREVGVAYKGTEIVRGEIDAMVGDKKIDTFAVSFSIGDSGTQYHNEIIKAPDKLLQIMKKPFEEGFVYRDVDGNNELDGDDTCTRLIKDNGGEWRIIDFKVKAKTEEFDKAYVIFNGSVVEGKGSIIGGNKARKALVAANKSYKLWLKFIFDSLERDRVLQDKI